MTKRRLFRDLFDPLGVDFAERKPDRTDSLNRYTGIWRVRQGYTEGELPFEVEVSRKGRFEVALNIMWTAFSSGLLDEAAVDKHPKIILFELGCIANLQGSKKRVLVIVVPHK